LFSGFNVGELILLELAVAWVKVKP